MPAAADPMIVVMGLGYVGLPLAVALADHFATIGFDIEPTRIEELRQGHDRTNEVDPDRLAGSPIRVTSDPAEARGADLYIVTVPTPVDADKRPDLGPVLAASRSVARMIDPGRPAIVVYESTVYPGVTEEICGPTVEEGGLRRGEHFLLGYSPERINPGDREHSIDRIVKVVAGENEAVTETLAGIYGKITSAGVFRAASIKAAEAAKVIENAQRDINIAFMNEVARIFSRLDLSVWDVLEAARTKWNFLPFQPGLVGGHCIGVDPYYLSHLAQQLGHEPRVILAGREINDGMGDWIAAELDRAQGGPGTVLVLGLTFKENVPDLRNSKVVDVVEGLRARGHDVTVHDPMADAGDARREYDLELDPRALGRAYDLVVCAVPHQAYREMADTAIEELVSGDGLLADLKGVWRDRRFGRAIRRWSL
jgi:UDP-N-acetyl-D-glucosamine/UDP-N-acetyl-D-galactosamine dehydrogenase